MKFGKYAKYYAVATQGILSMIVLLFVGLFLGRLIDKNSIWPGLLAIIGVLCGLVSFIYVLLKLLRKEDE